MRNTTSMYDFANMNIVYPYNGTPFSMHTKKECTNDKTQVNLYIVLLSDRSRPSYPKLIHIISLHLRKIRKYELSTVTESR